MSILIKGMEMPKSCSRCFCMASCRLWKNIMHPEFNRHRNCPLAHVPPHGKLIDANKLIERLQKQMDEASAKVKAMGEYDIGYTPDMYIVDRNRDMIAILNAQAAFIPAEPCNNLSKPCKEGE